MRVPKCIVVLYTHLGACRHAGIRGRGGRVSSLASEGEQRELVPTPCDLLGMYIIITTTNNIKSVFNTVGVARASFCFAGGGCKADGTKDDSK